MALQTGKISKQMKAFMKKVNRLPVKDQDVAIQEYCDNFEKLIYTAIGDITITIPPGAIKVVGTGSATNPLPIVLTYAIK
jgi:hypothetical protein